MAEVCAATIYIYETWEGNATISVSSIKRSKTNCTSEASNQNQICAQRVDESI